MKRGSLSLATINSIVLTNDNHGAFKREPKVIKPRRHRWLILRERAEKLSLEQFVELTKILFSHG